MSLSVYPETMGVPLEEMDAVFGEGACDRIACIDRIVAFAFAARAYAFKGSR